MLAFNNSKMECIIGMVHYSIYISIVKIKKFFLIFINLLIFTWKSRIYSY